MATSGSTNYTSTRDQIITRALRIVNEVGTGETPATARVTECALVLNDIFKEWQAYGMQMWKQITFAVTPVASTASYAIGIGAATNLVAPMKIHNGYRRNTTGDPDTDSPLVMLTKQEYDMYGSKLTDGSVNQFYYNPPGAVGTGNMTGTIYVINRPDADFVSDYTLYFTGTTPLEDFDASTDNPDVPSFYFNALVWALADQLSVEAGVPPADRVFIANKAEYHRNVALSYDQEEGSLFLQPSALIGEWS